MPVRIMSGGSPVDLPLKSEKPKKAKSSKGRKPKTSGFTKKSPKAPGKVAAPGKASFKKAPKKPAKADTPKTKTPKMMPGMDDMMNVAQNTRLPKGDGVNNYVDMADVMAMARATKRGIKSTKTPLRK